MNSELNTITEEFRKSKTELTNILGVSSITDIADGLKQLRQIKVDIKATTSSELGVSIPDGTPFADWVYEINPNFVDPKTYTVKIDTTNPDPEKALTYMDDAVGMTPGYDGWKNTPLMKNIKPCILRESGTVNYYLDKDNYALKEDGNSSVLTGEDGDVMVEIPLMGYKLWQEGNFQYVSVTTDPNKEKDGYCYYAHSLDNEKDCDKIYMGAYLGYQTSSKLYSRSSVSPTVNTSLTDFRTYAKNRGTGYSLTSFFPHTLLQCLYVIVYKNLNSQTALGKGYTSSNNSSKTNTGGTNSKTFCYGTTSDTQQVKLFGMEDFYGNLYQWLDGLYSTSNSIKTDYRNSVFTGSNGDNFQFNTSFNIPNTFYNNITKILGTNKSGFVGKEGTDSNSGQIYYCDYNRLRSGYFSTSGGRWDDGSNAGVFLLDVVYAASQTGAGRGARLMYKHKK